MSEEIPKEIINLEDDGSKEQIEKPEWLWKTFEFQSEEGDVDRELILTTEARDRLSQEQRAKIFDAVREYRKLNEEKRILIGRGNEGEVFDLISNPGVVLKEVDFWCGGINIDGQKIERERLERHYQLLNLLKKANMTDLVNVPAYYGVLTYKKQATLTNGYVEDRPSYVLIEKVSEAIDFKEISWGTKKYLTFFETQKLGEEFINPDNFAKKAQMKYERMVAGLKHHARVGTQQFPERGFLDDLLPGNFLIQVEKDSDGKAKLRGWLIDQ